MIIHKETCEKEVVSKKMILEGHCESEYLGDWIDNNVDCTCGAEDNE